MLKCDRISEEDKDREQNNQLRDDSLQTSLSQSIILLTSPKLNKVSRRWTLSSNDLGFSVLIPQIRNRVWVVRGEQELFSQSVTRLEVDSQADVEKKADPWDKESIVVENTLAEIKSMVIR